LADLGTISSPFHIQLSDSTVNFLSNKASSISEQYPRGKATRIFIGRTGGRNVTNYAEIVHVFEKFGFTEVAPHLMSFKEKVDIFSRAEFIVGPGSSGFANIIFCNLNPKILMFLNASRHQDMLLTKIAKHNNLSFELMLGAEVSPGEADSDYTIDIDELNEYLKLFLK
jgi:capsular polysaccharide biosynthesis protein